MIGMKRKVLLCSIVTVLCFLFGSPFSFAVTIDNRTEPKATAPSTVLYIEPADPTPPIYDPFPTPSDYYTFLFTIYMNSANAHVTQVDQDVYESQGYGFADVSMIVTNEGLVIIDTGDSNTSAEQILPALREKAGTDLPIKYIIYTHFHTDHIRGASVFYEDQTGTPGAKQIIAADNFEYWLWFQNEFLGDYHLRARAMQSGRYDLANAFHLPWGAQDAPDDTYEDTPMPTIKVSDEQDFTLGGKTFKVMHTPGETDDHLSVWMPDEKILFCGDLWYWSFPNLHSPMLNPRPIQGWIKSLKKFKSLNPDILVTQHGKPVIGAENVQEVLGNYIAAIEYVHDETVRYINEGKSEIEAANEIQLPSDLANASYDDQTYLGQYYGTVAWAVRGLYRTYIGYYDGHGSELFKLPPSYTAREIVSLAGGANTILRRAIQLQRADEHQRCIELCDIVIAANANEEVAARKIKAHSLWVLAYHRLNINNFGIYRSAYSLEKGAIEAITNP